MRLLFDENVSPNCLRLASEYPCSVHVRDVGLRGGEDRRVWDYARTNGLVIASKVTDFRERSYVEGAPPKVIWLDVGNAGTDAIVQLLRDQVERVVSFDMLEDASLLILSIPGGRGLTGAGPVGGRGQSGGFKRAGEWPPRLRGASVQTPPARRRPPTVPPKGTATVWSQPVAFGRGRLPGAIDQFVWVVSARIRCSPMHSCPVCLRSSVHR